MTTDGPGGAYKLWYDEDLEEVVAVCPVCEEHVRLPTAADLPDIGQAAAAANRHHAARHR